MSELLQVERDLAGVMSLSEMSGAVLHGVQRIAGASRAAIVSFGHDGRLTMYGGDLAAALRSYPPDLAQDDPILQWNARYLRGERFISRGTDDFWPSIRNSRACVEFYGPHGIGTICGVLPSGLPFGTDQMFSLLLVTPSLYQPFDRVVDEKLARLEIPMRAAARRIARFRGLEQQRDMLEQLLELRDEALLLWDAGGRLAWASPQAQTLLAGPVHRTDLERAARLALRQLRRTEASTRDAMLGRPRQVRSARGAPVAIEFSWLVSSDDRPWLLGRLDEEDAQRAAVARLTAAELRVLRLLMQGLSNRELGERLNVSVETIKTHVKNILAALRVDSRAKAAAAARRAGL